MPELPDVEAVRRYLLSRGLVGRTVLGAKLLWPRAIPRAFSLAVQVGNPRPQDSRRAAAGQVPDTRAERSAAP